MATFERTILLPRPLAASFAFVSDFTNSAKWDPRTYEARRLTAGPIGVGTKFVLRGGIVSKETLARFDVPDVLRQAQELPYEIMEFEPGRTMVLRGETHDMSYEDRLEFSADGDTTALKYSATLTLSGWRALGAPILDVVFPAIGDDATSGIAAAVEHYVPGGSVEIATTEDVRRVAAMDADPTLRNLLITQGYHDISTLLLGMTGGIDMNWCTLGTWASKTAGTFIRDEEVPSLFRKFLETSPHVHRALDATSVALAGAAPEAHAAHLGLIDIARQTLQDCSNYIMVGNKLVFAELGGAVADFVATFANDKTFDAAKLAAFQARYTEGDPLPDKAVKDADGCLIGTPCGGQGLLRSMAGHLYRAMFETDPKKRAELILFANAEGGLHEQTRLQTYIAGGLDAPITNLLVPDAHRRIEASVPTGPLRAAAHAVVDKVFPPLTHMIEDAWEDFATAHLMTLTLPDGVLHLSHPIPKDPYQPTMPEALVTIADPDLAKVLDKYGALNVKLSQSTLGWLSDRLNSLFGWPPRGPDTLADVGAVDWTVFEQRMRFILTLFRMRQQDPHLRMQPFTPDQHAAIVDGRIPAPFAGSKPAASSQ